MEEIGREANVGNGLQDERDERHALGLGRYAEQSHFGDRTGHVTVCPCPANHLPPTTRSAFLPDLACRVPYSLLHFTEWLSTVSETLDNFVALS
jgi:hypothetical protein